MSYPPVFFFLHPDTAYSCTEKAGIITCKLPVVCLQGKKIGNYIFFQFSVCYACCSGEEFSEFPAFLSMKENQ